MIFEKITIGIDQSFSCTAVYCHAPTHGYQEHYIPTKEQATLDKIDRATIISKKVANFVHRMLESHPMMELEIRIEGLSMGVNTTSSRDLAGLQFMIIAAIREIGVDNIKIIPPKTLKKLATGTGNADKQLMLDSIKKVPRIGEKVFEIFETVPKTKGRFDLADAFWLAYLDFDE